MRRPPRPRHSNKPGLRRAWPLHQDAAAAEGGAVPRMRHQRTPYARQAAAGTSINPYLKPPLPPRVAPCCRRLQREYLCRWNEKKWN